MRSKKITWIFVVGILTGYCQSKQKGTPLSGRVNVLERRLNREINARGHDVATIFSKIEEIHQRINDTLEVRDVSILPDGDDKIRHDLDDNKHFKAFTVAELEQLKDRITTLYRAFEEEKRINVETRDTIPEMRAKLEVYDTRMIDIQRENNALKTQQGVLKQGNQALQEKLGNVTEDFESRLQDIHEKYKMLVSKSISLQKEINDNKVVEESYSSCKDALDKGKSTSGIYKLRRKQQGQIIEVYCDQKTANGGWIVFQRRVDGSEDFYRGWDDYKQGFGNLEKEFWLGNELIHKITADGQHELRIDFKYFDGKITYAAYRTFKVHSEEEKYMLQVNEHWGNDTDMLTYSDRKNFTTIDSDNTFWLGRSGRNAAEMCESAWWFIRPDKLGCLLSDLNGVYNDLKWGFANIMTLTFVEMKTREK